MGFRMRTKALPIIDILILCVCLLQKTIEDCTAVRERVLDCAYSDVL